MTVFLAMAAMLSQRAPDSVERDLSGKCGIEVPRDANMSYAGDLWRVLYNPKLSNPEIQCIRDWARSWPKAGGIIPYSRAQFGVSSPPRPH